MVCPFCYKKFRRNALIKAHFKSSHYDETHSCDLCDRAFLTSGGRDHHRRDMHPGSLILYPVRKQALHEYYQDKVIPVKEDTKKSKAFIIEILQKLLQEVRHQDGGGIYSPSLQAAGSSSTNTKINYADEFDFELPLNVDNFMVSYNQVGYSFEDMVRNLNFCFLCFFRDV